MDVLRRSSNTFLPSAHVRIGGAGSQVETEKNCEWAMPFARTACLSERRENHKRAFKLRATDFFWCQRFLGFAAGFFAANFMTGAGFGFAAAAFGAGFFAGAGIAFSAGVTTAAC